MADSEQQSAAPRPPSATLGETLRAARLAEELTVEQVATELRIDAKQFLALEENRFEQIGVPVFVKGYLRQYGARLGLDVASLLALYHQQTTLVEIEVQPSRTIKLHDERQITSWVLAAIVLLAVIAGLAVWWWNGGNFGGVRSTQTTAPPAAAPADEGAQGAPAAAPSFRPPPANDRTLPAVDPPTAPGNPPVDQQAPATDVPAAAAALVPEPAAGDDAQAAAAVTIPLQFSFDRESWAEVTDARGERLLFGLNEAGRSVTVRGEPPFAIVLGDASGVRLTVDGAPYDIPTTGRQGNLARFAVDIAEE